jgi:hypothetical protein
MVEAGSAPVSTAPERPARHLEAVALVVYLGTTLAVTYGVWVRDDSGGGDAFWKAFLAAFLVHIAVGAVLGSWWVALVPIAWAGLSMGAFQEGGEIEDSVGLLVVFTLPFIWVPAVLVGVACRKIIDPNGRTGRRLLGSAIILAGVAVVWCFVAIWSFESIARSS